MTTAATMSISDVRRIAESEVLAEHAADVSRGTVAVNHRSEDLIIRISQRVVSVAKRHASSIQADDFISLVLSGDLRKDMAEGNAAKLIRSVVPSLSVAVAKKLASTAAVSRFTKQHYANTFTPDLTSGVNSTTTMRDTVDVYRISHREAVIAEKSR